MSWYQKRNGSQRYQALLLAWDYATLNTAVVRVSGFMTGCATTPATALAVRSPGTCGNSLTVLEDPL